MKIVAIIGSPNGMSGNTGRLVEEIICGIDEEGATVDIVDLSREVIKPCSGCDCCHVGGVCPVEDDYEEVKAKLIAADGFILATPNYIFNVSAQMKAFIDRCCALIHLHGLEGKYGVAVETSGGGGDEEVLDYMERFIGALGAQFAGEIGSPVAGDRQFPDQENLFQMARELGRDLCRSIREKKEFPEQEGHRLAFRARMKDLVDVMKEFWPYEYEYWQKLKPRL